VGFGHVVSTVKLLVDSHAAHHCSDFATSTSLIVVRASEMFLALFVARDLTAIAVHAQGDWSSCTNADSSIHQ